MNKTVLTIILIISLLLTFFAGFKCQQSVAELDEIGKPQILTTTLRENNGKPLYFVKKNWGYTGDHQIIALTSTKPDNDRWTANKSTDYVWEGEILIYYQQKGDTLKVWSNHLPDTARKISINKVIQFEEIKGPQFDKLKHQVDSTIKVIE